MKNKTNYKDLGLDYLIPGYGLWKYFKDTDTKADFSDKVKDTINFAIICEWNCFLANNLGRVLESLIK